jgi:hypothetical protein
MVIVESKILTAFRKCKSPGRQVLCVGVVEGGAAIGFSANLSEK